MKKISISINEDTLYFKYYIKKLPDQNLLNTNIISNNELMFSDDYILSNIKIVTLFIEDLIKENNTKTIIISNNELAALVFEIIKNIKEIEKLVLKDDLTLTYALCESIIKMGNIKQLDCYSIPTFLIELLDKNNIKVESRSEVLFTSNFMLDNDLTSFSKMYYKKTITINPIITAEDYDDIESFCNINKYLRVIHLEKYSIDVINRITEILNKAKKKNIEIEIHEDVNDENDIVDLRSLNKKYKSNSVKLSLVYSRDYLEQNYGKQIVFTTIKICSLIIFGIIGSVSAYLVYNSFSSERKVNNITEELKEIIEQPTEDPVKPIIDETEEPAEGNVDVTTIKNYDKLLEINSDTVGWIIVNNTKVDYPIVKTTDNSYYLKRNFYKEKDYNGWVFMDYRNSIDDLDKNTIIYAHNRYYSGVMFGTLSKVMKESWYKKEENLYITFNTLYEEYTWKIFSIYNIDVTSDYLYTNFATDKEFEDFLNMIKSRSIAKLDTEVTASDKIVTLSTCLDNNQRLVVHAVLQKKDKKETKEEKTEEVKEDTSTMQEKIDEIVQNNPTENESDFPRENIE